MLFSEFRPLYMNRLTSQRQKLLSPRTCGQENSDLTFRPILSPRNSQILLNRSPIMPNPELRRKKKFTDPCTFKPELIATKPKTKKQNFIISGNRRIPIPQSLVSARSLNEICSTQIIARHSKSPETATCTRYESLYIQGVLQQKEREIAAK